MDYRCFRVVAATALLTLCISAAGHAKAQERQPADAFLEDIIVVATKRPEPLQDIPLAVTAITGDALEKSGAEDVYELQQQAPALTVGRSQNSTTATFGIRGIFTSSQNFGLESSVGL
ncbi:MAG TPA: TonB-dependent receptor plug domain-containing protein, partial [Woeseiaceae bacterium]|nr:TonB-dependent receptor plug domain-containing protein [Woeseiaceae bacterium]